MNNPIVAEATQKASKTQKQRVLERLQNGERLSVRKIHTEMWINSPTKVISDLRKDGHHINRCRVETLNSHFYIYFMGEWNIDYLDEFLDEM